jgi:hypothetical protein
MMRENALKVFRLPSDGLAERPAEWGSLLPGNELADQLQ